MYPTVEAGTAALKKAACRALGHDWNELSWKYRVCRRCGESVWSGGYHG